MSDPITLDFDALKSGEGITIPVKTGCAVHGKLLTESGEPVGYNWIYLDPAPQYANQVLSRGDGAFQFNHLPNPGTRYTVRVGKTIIEVGPLDKGEITT